MHPRARRKDATGHLYVVSNPAWPGLVKIGAALNMRSRMWAFQTHDPNRAYKLEASVEVPHLYAVEREVQTRFAEFRCEGSEWFRVPLADVLEVLTNLSTIATNPRE